MLLQRDVSKSNTKRVWRSLQIFRFKISVHSVHSDRREMCSKKSGCTFQPPKGAGEASSTRPGFSQANCHGFHALNLTQFCRWRGKCSSGGVSLSIWIAYGQPERAHYSSRFKLCTDLTCSCYYLTAWMQKPDRYWAFCLDSKYSKAEASNCFTCLFSPERWIWWVLELRARLGGGAAGMMAAMTAGAWPWRLETPEFSSMSCFTIKWFRSLNGFESSLAPTAHICHKTLCAGFPDLT